MKVKKSELKTCDCAYLYNDGHFVMVHKKRDKDAGDVQWVTIYENIGIKVSLPDGYRLIIKPETLSFIMYASKITGKSASADMGSDNTKRLGIAIESISLYNGNGYKAWHITNMPDLISADIYLNHFSSNFSDCLEQPYYWASHSIKHIYRENV